MTDSDRFSQFLPNTRAGMEVPNFGEIGHFRSLRSLVAPK